MKAYMIVVMCSICAVACSQKDEQAADVEYRGENVTQPAEKAGGELIENAGTLADQEMDSGKSAMDDPQGGHADLADDSMNAPQAAMDDVERDSGNLADNAMDVPSGQVDQIVDDVKDNADLAMSGSGDKLGDELQDKAMDKAKEKIMDEAKAKVGDKLPEME